MAKIAKLHMQIILQTGSTLYTQQLGQTIISFKKTKGQYKEKQRALLKIIPET